ncbi:Uncharacterised protein [uncultured archaeon]|nr:Uncharacterised protein [uncultured archaeon]
MKNIQFLMALAVVCILIMPAFSMPIDGMAQDGKQKTCDCQHSMMNQDDMKMWPGQDDKQQACDGLRPKMDQDDMKMWQGQHDDQKTCGCPKSMMDQYGKQNMCQGHDGQHIKSMMGPDGDHMGHDHVKSMMGDRERGDNGSVKIVIVNVHV